MISDELLQDLALMIKEHIINGFTIKHLSTNLMNTIVVRKSEKGFEVDIPAELYDLKVWNKDKAIVYTGEGSYAQRVDVTGGFSRTHKAYVEYAINDSIKKWVQKHNLNMKGMKVE